MNTPINRCEGGRGGLALNLYLLLLESSGFAHIEPKLFEVVRGKKGGDEN